MTNFVESSWRNQGDSYQIYLMLEVQCGTSTVIMPIPNVRNVVQMQDSLNLGAMITQEYDSSVREVIKFYYIHMLHTNDG